MGQKILYSHLQQYKISCCHHRTNPFTMMISIKSREADSSLVFFFIHFVLPHFLKSTKQTLDFSINLKILLELLRRVGCNHLFTKIQKLQRFCSIHSFLGLPTGFNITITLSLSPALSHFWTLFQKLHAEERKYHNTESNEISN